MPCFKLSGYIRIVESWKSFKTIRMESQNKNKQLDLNIKGPLTS